MNILFAPQDDKRRVQIKVVGVGGAGGNAVNRMIEAGLSDVDFYAVNTDGQALDTSRAHQTLVIGNQLTRGLGAGGDPEVGRLAAEEDRAMLSAMVEDADMVFVTAGMGGGTGTGAAAVVAEEARAAGALTVAIVTRPFVFEGMRRMRQAELGLAALREQVDALLVIPNERLMEIDVTDSGMTEVFRMADNVLYEATRGISDIISQHAVVNLDFADVRTVMQDSGAAIMGTGKAGGENRAAVAAETAINSPLLEDVDIRGSRAVLVYITASEVTRDDLRDSMSLIQQATGVDSHIFFGFSNDETLGEDLQVTVIATGFPATAHARSSEAADPLASLLKMAAPAAKVEAVAEPDPEPESEAVVEADVERQLPPPAEPEAQAPEVTEPAAATIHLAEMAAAAGGGARVEMPAELQFEPLHKAPLEAVSEPPLEVADESTMTADASSQRFLEPMGKVRMGTDQPQDQPTPAAQRFRRTVQGNDKMRPAWERKYVD